MVPVLEKFLLPPKRKGDSFNFAFAAALQQGSVKETRYLGVLQFKNAMLEQANVISSSNHIGFLRKLEIILNKNGSVNAGLILPAIATQVFTFPGNYSDGHRHFIQTTLRDTSVTVSVRRFYFTVNIAYIDIGYINNSPISTNRVGPDFSASVSYRGFPKERPPK
jgi:hypothetical protein